MLKQIGIICTGIAAVCALIIFILAPERGPNEREFFSFLIGAAFTWFAVTYTKRDRS